MSGVCSAHRRDEKCVQNFGLKGQDHLEGVYVDTKIILKWNDDGSVWTRLIGLRTRTGGGLL